MREEEITDITLNIRSLRDRIGGIWAGIMRKKRPTHWENIYTLLCWFWKNLGQAFQSILGDHDAEIIKQQYWRNIKDYESYFKILREVNFPDKRKNPYWTIWFGENYIMWIPSYLYSNKYYDWIKNNITQEIQTSEPMEFYPRYLDNNKREMIGLNELKRFFEFCFEKQFFKLPHIIFPNGKTFP